MDCFVSVFHLASRSSLFREIRGEDAFSLELSFPTLPCVHWSEAANFCNPEETISSVMPPQSHQFIPFKDVSLRDSAYAAFTG